MNDDNFAGGIDGVHGLWRREHTRLWYRSMPAVDADPDPLQALIQHLAHFAVSLPDLHEIARGHALHPAPEIRTDQLVCERPAEERGDALVAEKASLSTEERQSRMLRRLGAHLDIAPVAAERVAGEVPEPLTDWRMVPRNAPTLLLASTELLDGRRPGPVLGPGSRYRIFSASEGVVGLEVTQADGETAIGYCNAVDLMCIAPMFANLTGAGRKAATKQRLRQITKGLNQVTSSLGSFMS